MNADYTDVPIQDGESGTGSVFHRPSGVVGMPERCSPEKIRFAALTRVLACSAPFRQISIRDGRLRREHLSDSGARLEKKKYIDSVGLLMEVADDSLGDHENAFFRAGRQPYVRSVLCPTSIIYPSGSRM
jgi:hypothetical protein